MAASNTVGGWFTDVPEYTYECTTSSLGHVGTRIAPDHGCNYAAIPQWQCVVVVVHFALYDRLRFVVHAFEVVTAIVVNGCVRAVRVRLPIVGRASCQYGLELAQCWLCAVDARLKGHVFGGQCVLHNCFRCRRCVVPCVVACVRIAGRLLLFTVEWCSHCRHRRCWGLSCVALSTMTARIEHRL